MYRSIRASPSSWTQNAILPFELDEHLDVPRWAQGKAAGVIEGVVEGKRAALLTILAARGLQPSMEARARIAACKEEGPPDQWITDATTATSIDEVFGAAAT